MVHGTCGERLLDSYSPERSAVGDTVLKSAERLTSVATLKNPIAQTLRNVAGHVLLGLPFVTHAIAGIMSETVIHYPDSPLNGPHLHGGPQPGDRVAPIAGQAPAGSGPAPRFVLHGRTTPAVQALAREFPTLVDADIRPALRDGAISLVRPDGYLAGSAEDTPAITAYLRQLAPGAARAADLLHAAHA